MCCVIGVIHSTQVASRSIINLCCGLADFSSLQYFPEILLGLATMLTELLSLFYIVLFKHNPCMFVVYTVIKLSNLMVLHWC